MALDLTNNNIFLSKITNSKPQIVSTTVNNNGLNYLSSNTVSGSTKTSTVAIAPMNCIGNSKDARTKRYDKDRQSDLKVLDLPKNFSWHRVDGYRGEQLTKPQNQGMCGCCWAMSSATVISDLFVTTQVLLNNPNLSTTWCLSCAKNPQTMLGCKGGNPAALMDNLQEKGIVTESCSNYNWCLDDPTCGPASQIEKEQASQAVSNGKDFNNNLPSCGCTNDEKHYMLKIKDAENYSVGKNDVNPTPKEFQATIKTHIYEYGPVVGIYLVFQNFSAGLWAHTSHGVYLENYEYTQKGNDTVATFADPDGANSQVSADKLAGGHAIAVIGWGITDEKVKYAADKEPDYIPYWVARNSWTEDWGEGGYFKMAMYPYNKMSQFDKPVTLKDNTGKDVFQDRIYGAMTIIKIDPTLPDQLIKIPDASKNSMMQVRQNFNASDSIVQEKLVPVPANKKEKKPVQIGESKNESNTVIKKIFTFANLIWVGLAILILGIGIYFWKKYSSQEPVNVQPSVKILRTDTSGSQTVTETGKTLPEIVLPSVSPVTVSPSSMGYQRPGTFNVLGAQLYG